MQSFILNSIMNTQYPITASSSSSAPVFDTYADFVKYLSGQKCPSCNTAYIRSSRDVESLFQRWTQGATPLNSQVQCNKCAKTKCIACSGQTQVCKQVEGRKVSWCCSRGRLFTIWVLLCGFDQEYCRRQRKEAATSGQIRSRGSSSSGVGYNDEYPNQFAGGGVYGFPGAGGRGPSGAHQEGVDKAKAESTEKQLDGFDRVVFACLAALCPSPHQDDDTGSFDINPPKAVVSMLTHSKILARAAELLRNDSLDNAAQRSGVYTAMIAFLKRVGVHDISKAKVVFSERMVLPVKDNLLTLSFGAPPTRSGETASSIAEGLQRLNIQSEIMMRGAQKARNEFIDKQGQDMLWLCREISDLSTYLRIEEFSTKKSCGAPASTDSFCVEVPDNEIWSSFNTHLARSAQSMIHVRQGRMRRLITEITSLKTGLSPGIYVKHAESRIDIMKALIVGPQGSPYENGLFEFDLLCDGDYPQRPPKVQFRYPRGCMSKMNPNLHLDGKVCLSLLGTWVSGAKGEEWIPMQSTLLQVLISIQAMIFCDDPMQNEPGQGTVSSNFARSDMVSSYNRAVRGLTVQYGHLHWAQNPSSLWKDVVKEHFRKSGDDILKLAERWANDSGGSTPYGRPGMSMGMAMAWEMGGPEINIASCLDRLQGALKSYGATYVPRSIRSDESQPLEQRGFQFGRPIGPYGGGRGRGNSFGRGGGSMFGGGW
ncbi:hypothetical protein ACN47E_000446 [Coniothyrium glycines]